MAHTAGPETIVYLHCSSILRLNCSRNALVTKLLGYNPFNIFFVTPSLSKTYYIHNNLVTNIANHKLDAVVVA